MQEVCWLIGTKLTVSRQDVLDYVLSKGFPDEAVHTKAGGADGTYLIRQTDGTFMSYGQERGTPYGEQTYKTYDAALRSLTEDFLKIYFR